VLDGAFAVCRLAPDGAWPHPSAGPLFSVTRTEDELSVVCLEADAPAGARVEGGWRALKLHGPIPFEQVGVLAALAGALAGAGLSVFALSTYDTDYLLVRAGDLPGATDALRRAGCDIG
jgi:hypothetical protein